MYEKTPKRKKLNSTARRRRNLWRQNKHCYFCGVETVLPLPNQRRRWPLNSATIDHLYPKFHSKRGQKHDGPVTVLSCWKCNQDRNNQEMAKWPLELKHSLAKRHKSRGIFISAPIDSIEYYI